MKSLICYFKGHNIILGLVEDDKLIRVQKCSRCGCGFGKSIYKPFLNYPPPYSSPYEIEQWKRYYEDKIDHARTQLEIL